MSARERGSRRWAISLVPLVGATAFVLLAILAWSSTAFSLFLALFQGVIGAGMAVAGVRLRTHPPETERGRKAYFIGFVGAGIVLTVLLALQTWRNTTAQGQANRSLEQARADIQGLRAFQTGGETICYVRFDFTGAKARPRLALMREGANPLYNVAVEMNDLGALSKPPKVFRLAELDYPVFLTQDWPLQVDEDHTFAIQINARNGYFLQTLYLVHIEGAWKQATSVWWEPPGTSQGQGVLVLQRVDRGFPVGFTRGVKRRP